MISKKEHIISITKISIFCILFLLLCILLNYLTAPSLAGDTAIISGFYGEEKNTLDVVYIGGSASFVYYQPLKAYEEYGITSYNFGANTIQAELYTYMIEEVLKKQNPKLLILDARAFQYRDKDQPPTEVAYRNVLTGTPLNINKVKFVEKNVKNNLKEKNTLSYYFSFIKFHSSEKTYTKTQAAKMFLHKYKHEYKGFMFIPKAVKEAFVEYETEEVKAPSKETVKILDDLLDYLKDKDIEVLFVVSPYIEEKEHKMCFNYVEKRVKEAGFDFIDANDYREEMQIDYSKDFYNYGHVNIYGSNKYTEFLCKYMIDNNKLVDHRNNPKYKEWDNLLPAWNEEKAKITALTDIERENIE